MYEPSEAELGERITADELKVLLEMLDAFEPEDMEPSEVKSLLGAVTPIFLRILAGAPLPRPLLTLIS